MKKIFDQNSLIFLIILLIISVAIGLANYIRLPLKNIVDTLNFTVHAIFVISTFLGVLYFVSINRYLFILAFGPILLIASITSWSLYIPNIPISSGIIDVMQNTEWNVTKEYITLSMVLFFLLFLSLISYIYYIRLKRIKPFKTGYIFHFLLAILLISQGWYINRKRSNTIERRVPFSVIPAFKEYSKINAARKQDRLDIGIDARANKSDSLIIVLVLGESVRNDHLGINGYFRNTTPNLANLGAIPLPKNKSLYTYTGISIPQILTRADSANPQRAYSEKSIIDIFNRCNFDTYWFANQNPEYSYYAIAKSAQNLMLTSLNSDEYSDKLWTDQNILSVFNESIKPSNNNKLLILHTIGSHWYCNYRYPENLKKYLPITKSRSINHNIKEEIINSYDNTILYMDFFVSSIINLVKHENCILIYISDHGELLGENNQWLHAIEHETLHNAASFI